MRFEEAFQPIRALGAAWRLLGRGPLTILLGGFLLFLFEDAWGGSGASWELDEGGWEETYWRPESLLFVPLIGGLCALGVGLWLFVCLLRVGFPCAVERIARSGEDDAADLFRSRGRWLNMVVASLLRALISLAALVPAGLGVAAVAMLGAAVGEEPLALAGGLLAACVAIPLVLYVWLGMAFVHKAVALEGLDPVAAIQRSWSLASGNRLLILLYSIVLALFVLVGVLACCVGVVVTYAVAETAWTESYLRLVRGSDEQREWWLAA